MKLAVLVAAAAQAKNSSWLKKEWEVQDAYFADEEIILSDLSIREGLKRKYRTELSLYSNLTGRNILGFPYYLIYMGHKIWNIPCITFHI